MAALEHTAVSRPRPPDFIPGYRMEEVVGRGGMGEVYRAVQLSLGRTVAVKLLNQELAKDSQFVARFEKEGAALAALRHPNIVSIVDKGKTDTTYYLVMEFVDGPSLREQMRNPLTMPGQALKMFEQVCRAIDYAHGRGVIHRDLKPENILFDEQAGGIAKVTDFGLAGLDERADKEGLRNLTQTHVAMGTAAYMAPEQQVDARTADQRADIYSLGVLLYELMVGETPKGNFDAPSVKKPSLDKRLDAIVSRCLKSNPADRYPSVGELLLALEPLVPVTSMIGTQQSSAGQRLLRKMRELGRRFVRAAELAVVLAAVAVLGASVLRDKVMAARHPAGIELTTDVGGKWPLTTPGRIDKASHLLTLGTGPDTISVVALGRKSRLDSGSIVYPLYEDLPTGRTVLDVDVSGDGLSFSSEVETQQIARGAFEPLRKLFFGPRPDARSALLLVGEPGRYVSLVVSGTGAEPVLEWALGGNKRGAMNSPLPAGLAATHLELRIDPGNGELSAWVGSGRDQRPLGEKLLLGNDWKSLFGRAPRAAVGCLEGTCAFRMLKVEGLSLPPPPTPVSVAVETPPIAPAGKAAVPAKKTPAVVFRPPPPAPVKKQTSSTGRKR
jgi:serine/threonine protein kinase